MTQSKAFIVRLVKTAIATCDQQVIKFRHLRTMVDEELDQACYGFSVNGVLFTTGWADKDYYSFLGLHPDTEALDVHDLKLLLWWLEQGDTKVNK
jgi:hypothetical protein